MGFYFSYDAGSLHKVIEENLDKSVVDKMYSEQELHCTMLYSDEEYKQEYGQASFPDVKTTIQSFEIWQSHNGFVLVARLDDTVLKEFNQIIRDNFGLVDSNPIFKPHLTLQKKINKEDLVDMKELDFLIGKEVFLENFNCLIAKNKPKNKVKL